MNDPMNRGFGIWPPPPPPAFSAGPAGGGPKPARPKWKRKNNPAAAAAAASGGGGGGYRPPTLKELQSTNRAKARRFNPKKKYAKQPRVAPWAPFNTTSFIIRAKKAGGIPSLVSPYPVTPAILPTPKFSPSREGLVDMAKEEWGVDGYGSMKGLIRLRPGGGDVDEDGSSGSSDSDVEEHVEVERRLDQDLSRFEMVYPNDGAAAPYTLELRVDDQDTHIARLEEENLTLKERMFLMEREMEDLRRRLTRVENDAGVRDADNDGDNGDNNVIADGEEDGRGDVCSEKSAGGEGEEANEIVTTMSAGGEGEEANEIVTTMSAGGEEANEIVTPMRE